MSESKVVWHSIEKEGLPPEHESIFCKFKGTDRWRDGMFETISNAVLITFETSNKEKRVTTSHTLNGKWEKSAIALNQKIIAWAEFPLPYYED